MTADEFRSRLLLLGWEEFDGPSFYRAPPHVKESWGRILEKEGKPAMIKIFPDRCVPVGHGWSRANSSFENGIEHVLKLHEKCNGQ